MASGDGLRVIVFGEDNLSNSCSVDGSGVIAMPLIGRVRAQGLTAAELAFLAPPSYPILQGDTITVREAPIATLLLAFFCSK